MSIFDVRLETERLVLRPTSSEDFEGWAAFMGDAQAAHHIGGQQPRAVAWRGFLSMAGAWQIQGFAMFSVIEKESGRWIGRLGPWQPEGWPGPEIGWAIARDSWGKGYAVEGASVATDWAFDTLGWSNMIHSINPANLPSQRVAQKLGSRNLGPGKLPPPFTEDPVDLWGQTRDEWRRSSTSRPRPNRDFPECR